MVRGMSREDTLTVLPSNRGAKGVVTRAKRREFVEKNSVYTESRRGTEREREEG